MVSNDSANPGIGDLLWTATARAVKTEGLALTMTANPMIRGRTNFENERVAVMADRVTSPP
jgi:hypothetical protein